MYQGNLREAFQDHHTNMSIGGRLLRTTSLMAGRSRELQDLADSLAVEIGREKSERRRAYTAFGRQNNFLGRIDIFCTKS